MPKDNWDHLIQQGESDRVEFTASYDQAKSDKYCQAVCAFSNDMPDHKKPGYLLFGVADNGSVSGIQANDQLLTTLAQNLRKSGNITPIPDVHIEKVCLNGKDIIVVRVQPSDIPPVRYKGITYIRTGAMCDQATPAQERILTERQQSHHKNFDVSPCKGSTLSDLSLDLFQLNYLPHAIDPEVLEENHRDPTLKLASLRFYDLSTQCPTHAGIILFGINPLNWLPGAYVQFLQIDGENLTDTILNEKKVTGDLLTILRELDGLIDLYIKEYRVRETALREKIMADYPKIALRELLMNAVMHRNYDSNTPIKFYWFTNRIEIQNPGTLYGETTRDNFPQVNSYRNPTIAEAMKILGYVNRFGSGVIRANKSLEDNDSPKAQFEFGDTYTSVTIYRKKS